MINIKEYKRRLDRLNKKKDDILELHEGKEEKYTYWAGYELGYLKGKINEIEEILDDLNEE